MSEFIPSDYDAAYRELEVAEGGYANVAGDSGGETYKGVTRRNFPDEPFWPAVDAAKARHGGNVKAINAELAANAEVQGQIKEFYRVNFWGAIRAPELDHRVAKELFDTAVNCGVRQAVILLQDVLNLFNTDSRGGELWRGFECTGNFLSLTKAALDKFGEVDGWQFVANVLNLRQAQHYFDIMRRKDSQEKFARGWVRARVLEQMRCGK